MPLKVGSQDLYAARAASIEYATNSVNAREEKPETLSQTGTKSG
jgi:hypothetical protein